MKDFILLFFFFGCPLYFRLFVNLISEQFPSNLHLWLHTYWLMICLWYLTSVHALYLVKFLVVTFLFLCQWSHLRGFCYLVDFLQLAPFQGISPRVLLNWLGAQTHPELCFGTYTFFRDLFLLLSSSITYIRLDEILLLSHFFCDLPPFRDLVMLLALLVTYIHLDGILLLSHLWFLWLTPF